ncbi:hypothetical protein D9757_013148 [Collybiopsis confluens]|uniref:Ubiquitin-like protease family profile domain-containing protein n=1 Tax=Collybiopsis confluens TaxID=2823264 RepID=A0A8H5GSG8_9AGAR|nr:hypothetical protein D9757_013148 [Collybiopsis confluens]
MSSHSTRIIYQSLSSPPRRSKMHRNCGLIDFPPFGPSRTCVKPLFEQILEVISRCKTFLPSISLHQLLGLASIDRIDALIALDFPSQPDTSSNQFYLECNFQIRQLREAAKVLGKTVGIHGKLEVFLRKHDTLPSDNNALIIIQNLHTLYECVNNKRTWTENAMWEVLDRNPEQATAKLKALMGKVSGNPFDFQGKLPFIQLHNFLTLGVGGWVDDEVINYFVKKWCSQSGTTIGFSTFFAGKVLFEEDSCINPKSTVSKDDEECLRGWYRDAVKGVSTWNSVFIPINERKTHWYSARIDFHLKRIDIYDSLEDRYVINRKKPVLLRKNAKLMMILMWLTEVLGQFRGEEVDLASESETDWMCDSHYKWWKDELVSILESEKAKPEKDGERIKKEVEKVDPGSNKTLPRRQIGHQTMADRMKEEFDALKTKEERASWIESMRQKRAAVESDTEGLRSYEPPSVFQNSIDSMLKTVMTLVEDCGEDAESRAMQKFVVAAHDSIRTSPKEGKNLDSKRLKW